jgi:hypothetical protein
MDGFLRFTKWGCSFLSNDEWGEGRGPEGLNHAEWGDESVTLILK